MHLSPWLPNSFLSRPWPGTTLPLVVFSQVGHLFLFMTIVTKLNPLKKSTRTFFPEKDRAFLVWIVYEFVNALNQQSPMNQFSTEAFQPFFSPSKTGGKTCTFLETDIAPKIPQRWFFDEFPLLGTYCFPGISSFCLVHFRGVFIFYPSKKRWTSKVPSCFRWILGSILTYFDSLNIQNTMNLEAETVEEFPRLHDQPTDKDDGETSWGDPGTRRFGWEGCCWVNHVGSWQKLLEEARNSWTLMEFDNVYNATVNH